jgi:elongation factor P hydroxylase
VLAIFRGPGVSGDTTGKSPVTKLVACNAIAEHLDYGRRYTSLTNQVQRSFEDTGIKQRALELVLAA